MFSSNDEISSRQVRRFLMVENFSQTTFIMTAIATRAAGNDGLLVVLLGSVFGVVYALSLGLLAKKINMGYIAALRQNTGYFVTEIIAIIYIIRFLVKAGFALKYFGVVITKTIMRGNLQWVIIIPIIIVCAYASSMKVEGRGRLVELIFWWMFIPFLIVIILSFRQINFSSCIPSFDSGIKSVLSGSYSTLLLYLPLEFILFSYCHANNDVNKVKNIVVTTVWIGIMNIVIYIVTVGMISPNFASKSLWPTLKIMQLIELPGGFIQRFDLFVLMFWIIGLFGVISGYLFYSNDICKKVFPFINQWISIVILSVILFVIAVGKTTLNEYYNNLLIYVCYFDIPLSLIIPCSVLLLKSRRVK